MFRHKYENSKLFTKCNISREEFVEAVLNSRSYNELVINLGNPDVTRQAIRDTIIKEELDISHFKRPSRKTYSQEFLDELIKNIKESKTLPELMQKMGIAGLYKSKYEQIKRIIKTNKIDISHFEKYEKERKEKTKILKEKYNSLKINENKKRSSGTLLKKKIIKEKLQDWKCTKCGLSEWNGNKIPLDVHHINKINYDNRIENLELLCPNCHRQYHNLL